MGTVFISYSQKDKERVTFFASILAQNGFDVWMDIKSIRLGNSILSEIVDGLNHADIYMLFISQNSSRSTWVNEELNLALTRNIEHKKPQIIPVLLDDSPMPQALNGRRYLDARNSVHNALLQFITEFKKENAEPEITATFPQAPILSEAIFGLSQKTSISIGGPFCGDFTNEDLINNRESVQKALRKKANGILMNFVSLSDFDLQSPVPKYKNGVYDEIIEQSPGSIEGSVSETITAHATIFNPDVIKLNELIDTKLDKLSATSLTYVFSIPSQAKDFDKKCMQRIQDKYPIISYDYDDGATIEYDSNFFVSIKCSLEQIRIKIEAKYDFLFSKHAVGFSAYEFVKWILRADHE